MAEAILFERAGAVGQIMLSRPLVGNALDLPMAQALLETAIACDEDDAIRCVLLTGAGRLFCAGGDVAAFVAEGDGLPAYLKRITTCVHGAVVRLARMAKPLVVAVNGPAAGAGIGLALIGDIVLAGTEAHFTLGYTAIGMSPDAGASWLLPRLVGLRRAQELVLRNRRVGADEAAAIGLVTRVVEQNKLADEAKEVADDLARGATGALGKARRLLWDGTVTALDAHLDAEVRAIAAQARSHDGREGIAAFAAKRTPQFIGGR